MRGMVAVWLLLGACAGADPADPDDTGGPPSEDTDGPAGPKDTEDTDEPLDTDAPGATVQPPLGETSGGSGGPAWPSSAATTIDGVPVQLLVPSAATSAVAPLLMVYSGVEGDAVMMNNMVQVAPHYGLSDAVVVVLDGRYRSAGDGAAVLDGLRAAYDIDNDRTWLLSESAGTTAGLQLGLDLRQSWFAACWANDVTTSGVPAQDADGLGFAPWGNAGPGGNFGDAQAIVDGMQAAGYRLPADAPYSGDGAGTHGSVPQFLAAVGFFAGKSRQ